MVQLHLDVAPQHHVFLVGRSACNIRMIMEQTTAKIELPEHGLSSRNGIFTVTGTFSAVIRARTLLVVSGIIRGIIQWRTKELKFPIPEEFQ